MPKCAVRELARSDAATNKNHHRGLFATQAIALAEEILAEKPLVRSCTLAESRNLMKRFPSMNWTIVDRLLSEDDACGGPGRSQAALRLLDTLCCNETLLEESWDDADEQACLLIALERKKPRDRVRQIYGRVCSNVIGTTPVPASNSPRDLEMARLQTSMALFPVLSRANHSCVANAALDLPSTSDTPADDHTRMHLVALCDIAPGEEITISYLGDLRQPQVVLDAGRSDDDAAKVRANLRKMYGFDCVCSLCRRSFSEQQAPKSERHGDDLTQAIATTLEHVSVTE